MTVHASNYVRVQHNFAYHIHGHSIFMEDGVEKYNVIEENLVAVTLASSAMLRSDFTGPANFWAATPGNFWRNNVGAGSASANYWVRVWEGVGRTTYAPAPLQSSPPSDHHPHRVPSPPIVAPHPRAQFEFGNSPNGPSASPDTCPNTHQLGEYSNNTGHSATFGLRIYPFWSPQSVDCGRTDLQGVAAPAFLYNSTFHHISNRGIFWKRTGSVHLVGFAFVENSGYDVRMFHLVVPPAVAWLPHLQDTLFVCNLRSGRDCPAGKDAAIHTPANEDLLVSGATFVNYGNVPGMRTCNECDDPGSVPSQGAFTIRTARLAFSDSDAYVRFGAPYKDIMWDLDGTLTSRGANTYVVPRFAFNAWAECAVGGAEHDRGHVCSSDVEVRRLHLQSPSQRALDYLSLNISSDAGVDAVRFRPAGEWSGWAVPLVTRRATAYNLSFGPNFLGDWTDLRLRLSEPEYTSPGVSTEWLTVRLAGPTQRYATRVTYAGVARPGVPAPLDPLRHPHGTGVMTPGGGNRSWELLLSARGQAQQANPFETSLLSAVAVFCPPEGCNPPPPVNYGNFSLWSDAATWPSGRVPQAGDNVVIPGNVSVLLDIAAPPPLGVVTVFGGLTFLDAGGVARTLTLASLVVYGTLTIGTRASPYAGDASIVFLGDYSGTPVRVDANLNLGNKVMAVLGTVSMVAPAGAASWGRLAATASAGATNVTLVNATGWAAGDEIALGSTGYEANETETATVTGVVGGRLLTLAAPLRFTHYAGPAGLGAVGASITLAGAVGRLSRRLRLIAPNASATDDYGFSLHIASTAAGSGTPRAGSVDMRGVQLRGCGKPVTGAACVRVQYGGWPLAPGPAASNPVNVFEAVAMADVYHYGVEAVSARHVTVAGSVLMGGSPNLLDFDEASGNATVVGNLLLGPGPRPERYTAGTLVWFRPASAVYMLGRPRALARNVVAGAYDAAYTYFPDDCDAADAEGGPRVVDNEAVSARVGVFALSVASAPSSCVAIDGFRLWMISHLAVTTVDQLQSVLVRQLVVADSHVGVSLNFVRADQSRLSSVRLSDSVLLGSTPASALGGLPGAPADCARNSRCRAMSVSDPVGDGCGSVLGLRTRRAGLMFPLWTDSAKTCGVNGIVTPCRPHNTPTRACSMPWERRFGMTGAVSATTVFVTNTSFVGFTGPQGAECAGTASMAITANPSSQELSSPVSLRGVTWEATPQDARFDFSWAGGPEARPEGSSAQMLALVTDEDGSTTGTPGSAILASNPTLATASCVLVPAWPGYVCPATPLRGLFVESMDADRGSRRLGALQVTRITDPADNATWLTSVSANPESEGCSRRTGTATYPAVVMAGLESRLFFPAVEPALLRLHFFSGAANESVRVRLYLQRRFDWRVFVEGALAPQMPITGLVGVPPQLDAAPGAFTIDANQKALWVVLRGGWDTYDLVRQAAVQVTLALNMPIASFFQDDFVASLARLLGIPAWRIKVVDVQAGDSAAGARRLARLCGADAGDTLAAVPPPAGGPVAADQDFDDSHESRVVWTAPHARRLQGGSAGALVVDVQVVDDSNATTAPVDTSSTTSVAAADEAHARLVAISSAVANATANGSSIGNFSVAAVAVEVPAPPPPVPTGPPAFVVNILDVVNGAVTNGTVVNASGPAVVGEIVPSVTPATTASGTPTSSPTSSASPSASITSSSSPSQTASASVTRTTFFYVRGAGAAPPQLSMLAWLRCDEFTDVGPLPSWRNAAPGATAATAAATNTSGGAQRFAPPALVLDADSGLFVPRFRASWASALALGVDLSSVPGYTVVLAARLPQASGPLPKPVYAGLLAAAGNNTWAMGVAAGAGDVAIAAGRPGAVPPAQLLSGAPVNASSLVNGWLLYVLAVEDGAAWLYRNGALVGTGALGSGMAGLGPRGLRLGGAPNRTGVLAFGDADVAELLVYRTSFGPSTTSGIISRTDIEGYLARKFNVQGTLPVDHPFHAIASATRSPSSARTATASPRSRSRSRSATRVSRSRTRTRSARPTKSRSTSASPTPPRPTKSLSGTPTRKRRAGGL